MIYRYANLWVYQNYLYLWCFYMSIWKPDKTDRDSVLHYPPFRGMAYRVAELIKMEIKKSIIVLIEPTIHKPSRLQAVAATLHHDGP